jgi:pSer/pThr/pTyr-binding forkhead associated (FHA) protein
MRVILEVQGGPQEGRVIALQSGEETRIGRGLDADAVFPEDAHMSGVHCAVQCGVKTVSIRDLGSTNGVRVNGEAVQSAALQNGDEVIAGRTRFRVQVREDKRAAHFADRALDGRTLVNVLRGDVQPLWAILDAARDKAVLPMLQESKTEFQSLYEGARGARLAGVAPYLVRLPADSEFIAALAKEGSGKSWGVFLTCGLPLKELRKHLRHFLRVTLPSGEKVLFRYYDPRVLRVYLPTCNEQEAGEFFGPVQSFLVEDEKAGDYLGFWLEPQGVGRSKLALKLS